MASVDEIVKLRQTVDSLRSKRDELQGKIKQLKKSKGDHDPEQLKKQLIQMETERVELMDEYKEMLDEFKKTYHEKYGEWPPIFAEDD